MPTGYTEKIYAGEPQTFQEFALRCAHGFVGAMRDMPLDAPLPEKDEPSSYERDALAKAVARLEELRGRTLEEWSAAEAGDRAETVARYAVARKTAEERVARYQAMLDQVRAWAVPTEQHVGLRDFMVEQLESSIRFDGSADWYKGPEPISVEEYRGRELRRAVREVEGREERWAQAQEYAAANTAWIVALRDSLGVQP